MDPRHGCPSRHIFELHGTKVTLSEVSNKVNETEKWHDSHALSGLQWGRGVRALATAQAMSCLAQAGFTVHVNKPTKCGRTVR